MDGKRRDKLARELKIRPPRTTERSSQEARAIVIAVKPQTIDAVLKELGEAARGAKPAVPAVGGKVRGTRSEVGAARLFISIAAGVPICTAGARARRARAGDPRDAECARDGRSGHGGAGARRGATKADETFALRIFRAVGDAVALDDEALLDAVTALTGSGPAYVYLFVKAMADAGVAEGLAAELAIRMALKTIRGAEENMRRSTMSTPPNLSASSPRPAAPPKRRCASSPTRTFLISWRRLAAAAERSRELGRAG